MKAQILNADEDIQYSFNVDYIDRRCELQPQGSSDRFLQIHSVRLDIDEIAQFFIFSKQVENLIPDKEEYLLRVSPDPKPENNHPQNTLISEVQLLLELKNNAEKKLLGTVNLNTHAGYLSYKVHLEAEQKNSNRIQDLRLLNLSIGDFKNRDAAAGSFSFAEQSLVTSSFVEQPRPAHTGFICWKGGLSPLMIPVYIKKNVLESFAAMASENHPKEVGAQLGGQLCRDGEFKYLAITEIFPFNPIGDEIRLDLPADEFIRTSQQIESNGRMVVGWIHSHSFGENALFVSQIDIDNHFKYTMPYSVMMIADSLQLTNGCDPICCDQCPLVEHCTLSSKLTVPMSPGWSIYGWTLNGSLISIPAFIFD